MNKEFFDAVKGNNVPNVEQLLKQDVIDIDEPDKSDTIGRITFTLRSPAKRLRCS